MKSTPVWDALILAGLAICVILCFVCIVGLEKEVHALRTQVDFHHNLHATQRKCIEAHQECIDILTSNLKK